MAPKRPNLYNSECCPIAGATVKIRPANVTAFAGTVETTCLQLC